MAALCLLSPAPVLAQPSTQLCGAGVDAQNPAINVWLQNGSEWSSNPSNGQTAVTSGTYVYPTATSILFNSSQSFSNLTGSYTVQPVAATGPCSVTQLYTGSPAAIQVTINGPITQAAACTITLQGLDPCVSPAAPITTATVTYNLQPNLAPNFVVTTLTDDAAGMPGNCTDQSQSGATPDASCSLRDAVAAVASWEIGNAPASATPVITFSANLQVNGNQISPTNPGVYLLTYGMLTLDSSVSPTPLSYVIRGLGANVLSVSGNGASPVLEVTAAASLDLSNLTLTGGLSTSQYQAGGLTVNDATQVLLNNVAITQSVAPYGGGILSMGSLNAENVLIDPNTLQISNSTISGNTATVSGGAIAASVGGTVQLAYTTLSGNTSAQYGGAVYIPAAASPIALTLRSSTVSGNTSGQVGGIENFGVLTLANSIVSGNTNTGGAGLDSDLNNESGATYANQGGNLVDSSTANLAALGLYGGATQVMLPLPGSPAICAGAPGNLTAGVTADQRGIPNTFGYLVAGASTLCADAGAVQTTYTPTFYDPLLTTGFNGEPPAQVYVANPFAAQVQLEEAGQPVNQSGYSIPLTLIPQGSGNLSNGSGATSATGSVSYSNLLVDTAGSSDQLAATLTLSPNGAENAITATGASSPFAVSTVPTGTTVQTSLSPSVFGQSVTFTATVAAQQGTQTPNGSVTFYDGATQLANVSLNGAGSATLSTSSLTAGLHTISADYSGTGTFASSSGQVSQQVQQVTSTVTWTPLTAIVFNTDLSGVVTASSPVAGTISYTLGSVNGTAVSASTVLPAGTYTIYANFTPTDPVDYTSVSVSSSLTVQQATPAVTWTPPTAIFYNTDLSGVLTASSPVAGTFSYTLGSVNGTAVSTSSILPAGTYTIYANFTPTDTVDYTSISASSPLTVVSPSANFGSIAVGANSAPVTVTMLLVNSGTLNGIQSLTQGTANLEFTNSGGGSCTVGTAYNAGSTCTVNAVFSPEYPGLRRGAIVLQDASGTTLATIFLYGIGTAPEVVFPGNQTIRTLGSSFSTPWGTAVDAEGNIYVADNANHVVKEMPAGCSSGSCVTTLASTSAFRSPSGIAVDGVGNIYVTDDRANTVSMMTAGCASSACVTALGGGFSSPMGVAVDGAGNVYIADDRNNAVKEMPQGCTSSACVTTLGGGFSLPYDVTVDGAGNAYVADRGSNAVKQIPSGCATSSCVVTLGGGFSGPLGVNVDGAGNVYVADTGNNAVKQIPAGCTLSTCTKTLGTGFSSPYRVALDGLGNVYVADTGHNLVKELDLVDGPTLNYSGNTVVGTVSAYQSVTVQNIGNAQLSFSSIAPTLASLTSSTCAVATPLTTAAPTCVLSIAFAPTLASNTAGSVGLIDNSLNNAASSQTVALTGTAIAATTSTFVSCSPNPVYDTNTTSTCTATIAGGYSPTGTVSFYRGGTCSVPGNVWASGVALSGTSANFTAPSNLSAFGSPYPVLACYSGDTNNASSYSTASLIVQQSEPTGTTDSEDFGSLPVASSSATTTVTLLLANGGTLANIQVLTQGAPDLDFIDVGGGSCTLGTNYGANATCTVSVVFRPQFAGLRKGAVQLLDNSSNVLATVYLHGVGTGPEVAFPSNLTLSALGGGYSQPFAAAVDGAGNVYVADHGGSVWKVPPGCVPANYANCVTALGGGFTRPSSVAVDGAGNVYVADSSSSAVTEMPSSCTSSACVTTLGGGFSSPTGVALDGSGDVYVADKGNGLVKEMSPGCTPANVASCVVTLGAGYPAPAGLAVDGTGNVYVVDSNTNAVTEMSPGCGASSCVKTLVTGFSSLEGVAVDAAGNAYLADAGATQLKEIPSGCGSMACVQTLGSTIAAPQGVALDPFGNLYFTLPGYPALEELELANAPQLTYTGSTAVGSTSTAQSVTVRNIGNATLTFSLVNPKYASLTGSTCVTGGTLTTSSPTCSLSIAFAPTVAGNPLAGAATLLDNALNATDAAQVVAISGTATKGTTTTSVACDPDPVIYGNSTTCTATIGGGSGPTGTVSFYSGSSCSGTAFATGVTVSGGQASFATATTLPFSGSPYTVEACYGGDANNNSSSGSTPLVILATNQASFESAEFGPQTVGTTSATTTVTLQFSASGTVSSSGIAVLTQGVSGKDFSNTGGGTCTVNTAYSTGQTCTVNVAFTPAYAGLRMGAVVLLNSGGTALATAYLSGIGDGPQVVFPGAQTATTLGGNFSYPNGVAVDISGNVYVADTDNALVKKMPAGCTSSTCVTTLGGGFKYPSGVAVDGAGNVYVADYGTNAVTQMPATCTSSSCVTTLGGGFSYPSSIALDGAGNVYVADTSHNAIKEMSTNCTSTACVTSLGGGFNVPYGVAVDGAGNVYVADNDNNAVEKMTAGCSTTNYSSCTTSVGGGFSHPAGVSVDAAGNIYVVDRAHTAVQEMPQGCTTSPCVTTLASGFSVPYSVVVDASGNVYVANTGDSAIQEIDLYDNPVLTYSSTVVGSLSTPQTVTVENIGNTPLNFSAIVPSQANLSGSTCSASTPLTLAAPSCTLSIAFAPTLPGASIAGNVTLDDNALSASQVIPLSGPATTTSGTTALSCSPGTLVYGNTATCTATVSGDYQPSGTVTFYSASSCSGTILATAGLSGGTASYVTPANFAAGSRSITACYSGDTNNSPSSGTASLTVNPAPLTVTANNDSKTYGQTRTYTSGSSAFTSSGLLNGETIGSVTIGVNNNGGAATAAASTYALTPSAATGGTFAAANYSISYMNGTLTVGKAALTITASNGSKTYGQTRTYGSGSSLFTSAGLQNSETIGSVTITDSDNGGVATAAAGGNYPLVPSAPTGGTFNTANYSITYVNGALTVGQAALSITASNYSKTYGTAKTYGSGSTAFTSSGLQNGETIGTVTIIDSNNGGLPAAAAGGSYPLVPSAATGGTFNAANYSITYNNGTLTVSKATLTVTASNDSKTYGQTRTYGTGSSLFTSSGLKNGEAIGSVTMAVSGSGGAATAAVGAYTLTPSAATGGTFTAANYSITYNTGTLTVGPATLTITAGNDSKTYGQTRTYGTGSSLFTGAGLQNSETIGSVTLTDNNSGGVATAAAGGNYPLVPSAATGGTFTSTNYSIAYANGALTVGQAALTIAANNDSKTYGQTKTYGLGSAFFTSNGLQNSETIGSVTITDGNNGGLPTAAAGGSYPLVPSVAAGGTFNSANYSIAYVNGALAVSKASLTITANNYSKTYGQTKTYGSGSTAFTSSGLENGETIGSVTITDSNSGGSATAAAGGSYPLVPTAVTGGTFSASNYSIAYTNGTLTVGKAALTITANNDSKTYGQTRSYGSSSAAFSSNGLENGETIGTVTVTDSNNGGLAAAAAGGNYPLVPSAATGGSFNTINYALSYVDGLLSVNQATAIITPGTLPTPVFPGGNFTVSAATTNTDNSALTYSVVSGPCAALGGGTFSSTGAGACVVNIAGAVTTNFTAASVQQTVTIASASPMGAWNTAAPPTEPVGMSSSSTAVTVSLSNGGTVGNIQVMTQGAPDLDFVDAGGGSCTLGTTYGANATCTVNVIFRPQFAGPRRGAVLLLDNSNNVLATVYLQANGTGPEVVFPSNQTLKILGGGLSAPSAMAIDGDGDVYVADASLNAIMRVPPGCTPVNSAACVTTVGAATAPAAGVAVDGAGNIYAAFKGASSIYLIPQGCTSAACMTPLGGGFHSPTSVAVDGAGNAYVADPYFSQVKMMPPACTSSACVTSLPGSFPNATGVAVDGGGNVYVSDQNLGLSEIPSGCNSNSCVTALGGAFNRLSGVAVDALGNAYVSDLLANAVEEVPAGCGSASCVVTLMGSVAAPAGVVVDASGNVYFTPTGSSVLQELDLTDAPQLAFATTTVGMTSVPQSVTVQNIGNTALNFTSIAPATASLAGSTCAVSTPLTPAAPSCTLSIAFAPAEAADTQGSVLLLDNAFNATGASQAIEITGTAAKTTTSTAVTCSPNSLTYGSAATCTATVSGGANATGAVAFYQSGTCSSPGASWAAPVNLSGGAASFATANNLSPASSPYAVLACYSGDGNNAASGGSVSLTVSPASLTIAANNDSKIYGRTKTYGAGSTAFTSTGLQNGETIGSVTITDSNHGGVATAVAGGNYPLAPSAPTGTLNPANYSITYANGALTVGQAVLTVTANSDSKTYGQTKTYGAGSTAFTSTGLQNGEAIGSVTINDSNHGGVATAVAGGNYPLVPSAPTGTLNAANYSITYANGALTVGQAALTITANSDSKTYGQTRTYGLGSTFFTSTGLQNGETIGSVTIIDSNNGGLPAAAAGGNYPLVPSTPAGTLNPANYSIAYVNGALTVGQAALTIAANGDSKTYGQTKSYGAGSTAFTSSGLRNGETIGSVTITDSNNGGAATAATGASYPLAPSAATGGTFSPADYSITYINGTLAVGQASLTITANNDSKTYGQTKSYGAGSTAFTSTGLQNGETVGSVTITDGSNGGAATAASGSTYPLVPSAATGGSFNAASYSIAYNNGALKVNQATPSLALQTSATAVFASNNVTLSAKVTYMVGQPTGAVTFYDSAVPIGAAQAVDGGGNASLTTSALSAGTHSIKAVYSGDSNFVSVSSSPLTQTVQDFDFVVNGSNVNGGSTGLTATVLPGNAAVYQLTVSPLNAATFPGDVQFTLTGLPQGATYTITPSTLAAGSGSTQLTVTVQTVNPSAALQAMHGSGAEGLLALAAIFPMGGVFWRRKTRKRMSRKLLLLLAMAFMFLAGGCGSGSGFNMLAPQTYTLTINATSGALAHSATMTLAVE